jgi:hypothetical protein
MFIRSINILLNMQRSLISVLSWWLVIHTLAVFIYPRTCQIVWQGHRQSLTRSILPSGSTFLGGQQGLRIVFHHGIIAMGT